MAQLLKCLFTEWSLGRSLLCCAETYFHNLPGDLTSSLTFFLASSLFVLSLYKYICYCTALMSANWSTIKDCCLLVYNLDFSVNIRQRSANNQQSRIQKFDPTTLTSSVCELHHPNITTVTFLLIPDRQRS